MRSNRFEEMIGFNGAFLSLDFFRAQFSQPLINSSTEDLGMFAKSEAI